MEKVNEGAEGEEAIVNSRYSVVMGTSKRARQIIAADNQLIDAGIISAAASRPKALSRAIKEIDEDAVHIVKESCDDYESYVADEDGRR